MDFINSNLLSLIVFSPAVFAVLLLIVPVKERGLKYTALIFSLITTALTIFLWIQYPAAAADPAGFFGQDHVVTQRHRCQRRQPAHR